MRLTQLEQFSSAFVHRQRLLHRHLAFLLGCDSRIPDKFGNLDTLVANQRSELFGCVAHGFESQTRKILLHFIQSNDAHDLGVQTGDDITGGTRTSQIAQLHDIVITGHRRFSHCRHIRKGN